jgi:hypothetical protein
LNPLGLLAEGSSLGRGEGLRPILLFGLLRSKALDKVGMVVWTASGTGRRNIRDPRRGQALDLVFMGLFPNSTSGFGRVRVC